MKFTKAITITSIVVMMLIFSFSEENQKGSTTFEMTDAPSDEDEVKGFYLTVAQSKVGDEVV